MTRQEVYNKVRDHLLAQGEQSAGMMGCQYRAERSDGTVLMCAIGCLIPDELYDDGLEGMDVGYFTAVQAPKMVEDVDLELVQEIGELLGIWDVTNADRNWIQQPAETDADKMLHLLSDLQIVHDQTAEEEWLTALEAVAKEHGLTP